ncbi:MAG TPA: LamG-like jellyroll fold domain-containing protein [Bryobacteraceae bacterium]|nr:LamG-like jellyroll fold domain-containing protein [Bryobacteraceae bacterium]
MPSTIWPHLSVPGRRRAAFTALEIAALMLCLAAVSLPARAAAAGCLAPPSGLVSWWPGDTDNNDLAGANNPNAASGVTLVPAEVSNGFHIGTKGYLEVPASKSLANQNFTWAVWVRPDGAGPNNDSTGSSIVQQDIDDYSLSMALYWRSQDNRFVFVFGNTGSESFASKDTFSTGVFYHVATTYDGSVFRLFVNGVAEGSFNEAKPVSYSTNPWTIGSSGQIGVQVGFPRTLNGVVDEVQAFNRALSQSELEAIYAAGSAGECKDAFGQGPGPGTGTGASVNAASYANPILPGSGIAQGSLFTIFGSNLGPSASPSLSFPLSTTLGGAKVNVTQGGETIAAIPVFVSGSQVNAIMPSNAPLGDVTITVSYAGQVLAGGTAQVVPASFGIFAANSSGSGRGIITNTDYAVIGYNSPAHPGDTLIVWGTGLGAISGSDAEPPPVGNIGSHAPTIYFGGSHVTPSYYGRSGCCSGLDQIVFRVPPGITGCNIPVAVETGNTTSNFVNVAIAPSGDVSCSDPSGISATELSKLVSQNSGSIGSIFYNVYDNLSPGFNLFGGSTQESTGTQELATFFKYQFTNVYSMAPVLNSGACTVYGFSGTSFNGPGVLGSIGLDAGSSITVAGGGGQGTISESSSNKGVYSNAYDLPNGSVTFTGTGGSNVGPFNVTVPITAENLQWTNEGAISSIDRASGVTLTWSGANPDDTIQIMGFSIAGTSTSTAAGAGFTCTAPAGAGQFKVPAEVLQALPASASLGNDILSVATGFLGISQVSVPVPFTATGLDLGYALTEATITNATVAYQ